MPILATVDYTSGVTFTSKAGIELPDKFKPMGLTDRQKFFEGILLKAKTDDGKLFLQVSAGKRSVVSSMPEFVKKWKAGLKNFDDPTYSETEELTIDGFPTWRFEQKGKLKNLFGTRMTMLHTVMEAKDEYLIIQAWGYDNDYSEEVEAFKKLPSAIKGLTPPTPIASAEKPSQGGQGSERTDATPPPPPQAPPEENSTARRLRELGELRKQGLITEKEYNKKRQAILSDM
ncbi:MAG TPA: SHOCT domain-containing protein [Burkholderiales bacterium]|nr:SHOCT domain-containing protein [Burkholderiales bacterium]